MAGNELALLQRFGAQVFLLRGDELDAGGLSLVLDSIWPAE